MKVQILGTGCKRCDNLYANTVEAASRISDSSESVNIEKVGDPAVFVELGVAMTPALVIDGKVVSTGKELTPDQIEAELRKSQSGEAP